MKTFKRFSLILTLFLSGLFFHTANAQTTSQNDVFVTADWVTKHQDKLLLVDLSSQQAYQKFHLPSAIWVNYDWLIRPQNGLALSGGEKYMVMVLSQLGIQPQDHIVLYDDIGNLNASRLLWELKKLGHNKVSLLDGGIVEWILKGKPVTQTVPKRLPISHYPLPTNNLTDVLTADKKEVLAAIDDPKITLLDARSEPEYIGDKKQKRTGHIPSARWFDWSEALDVTNGFKQLPQNKLLDHLKSLGISDKQQPIIVYCNSGHRASRSMAMLESLGFNHVKLYDGSMQEYGIDKTLPLKLGKTP
ncbi:rhodanese-like domain-containing protein [Thiomicrorhabdus sp. ZW0627]|uniref:sulfurtransferase n=1 Tax=Thiomicrorhabdus sp. ZW0627 TaxID=3039774 RepID=UPI002436D4F2|nr:rhodanese-like domain-containing protein [Thiomicrorhabdus sp. ZW0627]MDG6773140.1 rhodanese-like domain-containing protein [Thiomicrorhabdus sp. ZW0627]